MVKKEDIQTLNQLLDSLEMSLSELERAYEKKDSENFNKLKKIIIQTQRKISEIAR